MSSTAGALRLGPASGSADAVGQLRAALSFVLLALIVGLALVLLVRRLSGAFHEPLTPTTLVAMAIVVAFIVTLVRQSALRTHYSLLSSEYEISLPRTIQFTTPPLGWIVSGLAGVTIFASLAI